MSTLPRVVLPDGDEPLEGVDELASFAPQEVDPTSSVRVIDVEEELEELCRQMPPDTHFTSTDNPSLATALSDPPLSDQAESDPALSAIVGDEAVPADGVRESELEAFDELEADLQQAMAEVETGKRIKDKRRRLALVADLSAAERAQLALTVHNWEAANEWESLDVVLIVEHQHCTSCKAVHESTFGVYTHQRSRRKEGGFRWTKYWHSAAEVLLPRSVAVKFVEVEICPTCAEKSGFVDITELSW